MSDVHCPKCGVENPPDSVKCRGCGAALAKPAPARPERESVYGLDMGNKPPIAWGAAGLGVLIILALQFASGFTVAPYLVRTFVRVRSPNLIMFWLLMLAVSAVIYFVAGFLLGRYSKGYLVREPAISAVVAAPLGWLAQVYLFKHVGAGIPILIVSIVACAALGYAGGVAGEQVQQRARERRRAAGGR